MGPTPPGFPPPTYTAATQTQIPGSTTAAQQGRRSQATSRSRAGSERLPEPSLLFLQLLQKFQEISFNIMWLSIILAYCPSICMLQYLYGKWCLYSDKFCSAVESWLPRYA